MDCLFWKEMVGLMLAVLTSTGEGRAKIGLKEQQFNAFEGTNASPVFYHASLQLVPVWVPKICLGIRSTPIFASSKTTNDQIYPVISSKKNSVLMLNWVTECLC